MPPVKGARIFPITTLIIVIEVAQLCPTLCDPVDYSPPGSSIHGIFQASILEWVAISFSRRSSQPRDSDAGKDRGQEEKGTTEDEMNGWHHRLDDMSLSELQELVMDTEAWRAVIHQVAKNWT